MTEPGTSLLGRTAPSPSLFLTSGLTWSAGMKSCTGRSPAWGRAWGGDAGAARGAPALAQSARLSESPGRQGHTRSRPAGQPLHARLCFLTQLRSAVGEQGAAEGPGEVPHTDPAAHGQQVRAAAHAAQWERAVWGVRCAVSNVKDKAHGERHLDLPQQASLDLL